MTSPTPAQRLALQTKAAWMIWGALQAGVLMLVALRVGMQELSLGRPMLSTSLAWVANVFAGIAAVPVVAGIVAHWFWVRGEPDENRRSVRRVRELLLDAKASAGPNTDLVAVAVALESDFRGASIVSWALGEGGALLGAISIFLCGFQPAPLAIIGIWFLSMQLAAPTRALRDSFRIARLRLAGLTEEQARTLLARADELARETKP